MNRIFYQPRVYASRLYITCISTTIRKQVSSQDWRVGAISYSRACRRHGNKTERRGGFCWGFLKSQNGKTGELVEIVERRGNRRGGVVTWVQYSFFLSSEDERDCRSAYSLSYFWREKIVTSFWKLSALSRFSLFSLPPFPRWTFWFQTLEIPSLLSSSFVFSRSWVLLGFQSFVLCFLKMAEFPPNLDDGELWLPSDIFPEEVPSKFGTHHLPSEFAYMSDIARQFAAFTLLQPPQTHPKHPLNLAPNLEVTLCPLCSLF